jgi:pantothenate synthetase
MVTRSLKSLFIILLSVVSAFANPNPFGVSDDLDKSIQAGLHALYSLKFEEAEKIFDSIKGSEEEHPMVAFGKASVH